jgi:hypothetical protein
MTHGPVRAVPLADGSAFLQTSYVARAEGTPAVARVALLLADGKTRVGRTVGGALGVPHPRTEPATPLSAESFESRVRALYGEMRRALSRGDWAAFGAAYSALGDLLARRGARP